MGSKNREEENREGGKEVTGEGKGESVGSDKWEAKIGREEIGREERKIGKGKKERKKWWISGRQKIGRGK